MDASMRPPGEAGGNIKLSSRSVAWTQRFNEAAGGSRRKPMEGATELVLP